MTIFDIYHVTPDDAQRVEAILRAEEHPEDPAIPSGPLNRLTAAVQSMNDRSDRYSNLYTGEVRVQEIKEDIWPISGRALWEGRGHHAQMRVTWESAGGYFSSRAWHLNACLHVEIDAYYGDTYMSLTDVALRVAGNTGNTLFVDDGGLARLVCGPLRSYLARQNLRRMVGIEIPTEDEVPDMPAKDWFITMNHQRSTWTRGWGIEGEETPQIWLNASPYDVILVDGTVLEAADSPAWIFGRGTDSPEPMDLPDPKPGQAVIVTEAIALLSPHRRDLVYPAPAGPVLIDNRGERFPVKSITRY